MQAWKIRCTINLRSLLIGRHYLPQLKGQRSFLKIGLGKYALQDLSLARRWDRDQVSPFEKIRTMNPEANMQLNQDALSHLKRRPMFEKAEIEQAWAGVIDRTDSNPVIDRISQIEG